MGLFTKEIGPVFLKSSNQAAEYIEKLKLLQDKCDGSLKEEIDKQIAIAEYGIKGEQSIAFELKNSGMDMYILQDICLEHGELSAQIDYMIVTRKRIYIIECKNMIGDIEVNNTGDFIRTYQLRGRRIKEGIYSPITQNIRHLQIVKEVRKADRKNIITKKLFENHFEDNYKSIVVLANPKTVLYAKFAKKEVKEQIVRVDQLVHKIKEMDKQVKDGMSEKEMAEIANFFLEKNKQDRSDYTEKYEKILAKAEISNEKNAVTEDVEVSNEKEVITKKVEVSNEKELIVENVETSKEKEIITEKVETLKEKEIITEKVEKSEAKEVITENVSVEKDNGREKLIAELKAFRLERSRQEKVKPYFIFNDAQMADLIEKNPKDKTELCQVSGFGPVKAEKYGDVILEILRDVEE